MTASSAAGWDFARRLRRHAYGWRSAPAVKSVKAAASEIKKAARRDALRAAEGAVLFLERVSPAIEQVDGSSGAIGTAVRRAVIDVVPLIVGAEVDDATRDAWLERLWQAFQDDEIPYIEHLGDFWGELCVTKERASAWADELLDTTRRVLLADPGTFGIFAGVQPCLSALYRAERYEETVELIRSDDTWSRKRWAVRALTALGRKAEALALAEASRSTNADDREISALCEEILLSSGLRQEAYRRYAFSAHEAGTYLAWFRAVCKAYPEVPPRQVLVDLVAYTPGNEGKWFAAAKSAGFHDEALALARRSPCDPRTLLRASRDFSEKSPAFALEAALLTLVGLIRGDGYDIPVALATEACDFALQAAGRLDGAAAARARIRELLARPGLNREEVARVLRGRLDGDP